MTRTRVLLLLSLSAVLVACAPQGGDASAPGGDQVVAYVGDESITMAQLEERAQPELAELELDRFEALQGVLEQMVAEKLVTDAAASRGMTTEELIQAEVLDRIGEPTEQEIEQMYKRHEPRIGHRPIEEMRPLIIETIYNNKSRFLRIQFLQSLKDSAGYRIEFEPARAEIETLPGDVVRGTDDAPVTIVEFADFQCPYSKRVHPTVERLLLEYDERIRFVFREYPLEIHSRAVPAAQAARCAADQGMFWDYYQHLMALKGDLSDDDLRQRASEVGLNEEEFATCYADQVFGTSIQTAVDSGRNLGVQSTPTFFINGRRMIGSKTYEELKAVIDDELRRAEPETAEEAEG